LVHSALQHAHCLDPFTGAAVSIRRNRKAATLAIKASELGVAAPLVVAHRLTRMALAGSAPSARDRREFTRMSTEKVAAFSEAWRATFTQAIRIQQDIAVSTWRSFWFPWLSARPHAALPKVDLAFAARVDPLAICCRRWVGSGSSARWVVSSREGVEWVRPSSHTHRSRPTTRRSPDDWWTA
jgi:hypothetical protein